MRYQALSCDDHGPQALQLCRFCGRPTKLRTWIDADTYDRMAYRLKDAKVIANQINSINHNDAWREADDYQERMAQWCERLWPLIHEA